MVKVTFAQAQDVLSYLPAYIARAKFLPEAGIEAEFIITQGGGPTSAAVSSGSVAFGLNTTADLLNNASRGARMIAIQAMMYETQDVVANRQWVQELGLSQDSPLQERLEALKGAVIGATSAGASSELLARFLLREAGLPPEQAQIVPIGGLNVRQAALQRNQIQAYIASPPAGPQAAWEGFGYVLIPSHELPGFSRKLHGILSANTDWLRENPAIATRVATAFAKANNYVIEHPEESLELLRPFFPNLIDEVLRASFYNVQAQTVPDGLMTEEGWEETQRLLKVIGAIDAEVDVTEGMFWTNAYIDRSQL